MTWLPDDSPDCGGGDSEPEDLSPSSPPPVVTTTATALEYLADAHARIIEELDQGNLPPGTLSNALSSLSKLAIARAEISLADLDPDPDSPDAAAAARAQARTDQLVEVIELYCVRLLELHDQASRIFAEMADSLAGYTRDCKAARPLWMGIRRAQSAWSDAHEAAVTDPELPDEPDVDPQGEPDCQGPDDRHVDPHGEPLEPLDPVSPGQP